MVDQLPDVQVIALENLLKTMLNKGE